MISFEQASITGLIIAQSILYYFFYDIAENQICTNVKHKLCSQ